MLRKDPCVQKVGRENLLGRRLLAVVVLSSFCGLNTFSSAYAIPFLSSKKSDLATPGYTSLGEGAGPATHDAAASNPDPNNGTASGSSTPDLSPMKLTDDPAETTVDTAGAASPVLKTTVTSTNYVAPQTDATALQPTSVSALGHGKGRKSKSLVDQAKDVGVAPVPLMMSQEEAKKKAEMTLDAEKEQLADLWEATLTRSPDIQFIVQKLQPTSNQAHLSTILTRMLSTAAYGGMGAVAMVSPGMGSYAMSSAGSGLIQNVLGMQEARNAKKAKLSQEEQLMMFNIVRNTCDKLVGSYRDYKKCSVSMIRASQDLQDLQGMVADARSGQDSSKQLEMEYTLRKQQRDLDGIVDDVRRHRQSLIDLSGPDAVAKLDKQITDEQSKLNVPPDAIAANDAQKQADPSVQNKSTDPLNGVDADPGSDETIDGAVTPSAKKTASSDASPES